MLIAEVGQVGKDDRWRISFPQLPPYVRTAEDLQRLVEPAGGRGAWGSTIHTSLGSLDGRDGRTTHFGFSNAGFEREMYAVFERVKKRGEWSRGLTSRSWPRLGG